MITINPVFWAKKRDSKGQFEWLSLARHLYFSRASGGDPANGEYVIISTQAGGACYCKGFKASHKPKTMEKMRFAQ